MSGEPALQCAKDTQVGNESPYKNALNLLTFSTVYVAAFSTSRDVNDLVKDPKRSRQTSGGSVDFDLKARPKTKAQDQGPRPMPRQSKHNLGLDSEISGSLTLGTKDMTLYLADVQPLPELTHPQP